MCNLPGGNPFITALREGCDEDETISFEESEVSALARQKRLPRRANMGTIIDTVLRDAPFTEYLRGSWYKLLKTPSYQELSSSGFWWLLNNVIEPRDRGEDVRLELEDHIQRKITKEGSITGNGGQLKGECFDKAMSFEHEYTRDEHFGCMALNFVNLFRTIPSDRKDYFLNRFFEIFAYTILLILSATKRRDSISQDIGLKRYLINSCAEWTTGVRPCQIPDDHWVIRGKGDSDGLRRRGGGNGGKSHKHNTDNEFNATNLVASMNDTVTTKSISSAHTSRSHTRGGIENSLIDALSTQVTSFEPKVRASITFQNSPFLRYYLAVNDIRVTTTNRISMTINASRLPSFIAHHVPSSEQDQALSTIRIGLRSAHVPFPARHVLKTSRETRRELLDNYRRQKEEARKATASYYLERRNIADSVDARAKSVLESDTLREYATNLALSTQKPSITPHSTGPRSKSLDHTKKTNRLSS